MWPVVCTQFVCSWSSFVLSSCTLYCPFFMN
uniref:Uncharacterized protein n=1 Tax=Triticum urartu TaxID=4572 RepID=A0A8R7TMY7_TRIUA